MRKFFRLINIVLALTLLLTLGLVTSTPVMGDTEFVLVTNVDDGTLSIVDASNGKVYGPFLDGELGSGSLLDIAVTPDGETALISNFGDNEVFFVDISDPADPYVIDSVTLSFSAEDIAITYDGDFALVTDGGSTYMVASIDIEDRSVADELSLEDTAQAVAVTPGGTVIVAGCDSIVLNTLTIDNDGELTEENRYTEGLSDPINVGVAPDGETVIICNNYGDTVAVYQETGVGELEYIGMVDGLPGYQQSVTFDGDKAYVLSANWEGYDSISILDIDGVGDVSLDEAAVATLSGDRSSYYGVDALVVVGDNLYVGGNPLTDELAIVDLDSFDVDYVSLGDYPAGVASSYGEFGCKPPTASISASITIGEAPLTVQFRGSSNQSGVDYSWSFGTGDDSDSRSPSYTFQNEGTFEVFLTVTNECGKSATDSITINVDAQNIPPVLVVQDLNISPTYANYGEPVYITATVFNQGGSWGSQDMHLLINGQFEQSVPVGVAAGTGQAIDFTVYKTEAREYQVTIGEATGTFYLMEQAAQQTQSSSLLAGGDLGTGGIIAIICIAVILVAGIILVFLFARRA